MQEGHLRPGGRLPCLTMSGGLSYNHPGALGILLLVEAVRQLRGECGERQVPVLRSVCARHRRHLQFGGGDRGAQP